MVKNKGYLKQMFAVASIASLLSVLVLGAQASASSQSFYVLNQTPQQGMLMSLTKNPGVMAESTTDTADTLVGVVAPSDEVSLSQQQGQVSIRTDGEAIALVSTLGGDISVGDRISPSSLLGVGEKLEGDGWIIGTAQASLDKSSKNAVKTLIKDSHGAQHTVYVASIPVLVQISYYTAPSNNNSSLVPNSLQSTLDKLAGKHVTLGVIVISSLLLLIGIYIGGTIINSAVRGGLLAISRQPLTKKLIYKNIFQAFGMAGAILLLTLAFTWVVLRLA